MTTSSSSARWCARRTPKLRILLTVSPVPLTATAGDDHVLLATTYSKSVLRAGRGPTLPATTTISTGSSS